MAITVGTDSYISVTDADTYFSNLGNTTWSGKDTSDKEVALRKACDYIESEYSGRWKGAIASNSQALAWPRSGVRDNEGRYIDNTEYPTRLVKAQCELALKTFNESLMPDQEAGAGQLIEKTTGPITKKWAPGYRSEKTFSFVEALLKPYLRGSKSSVDLIRA